MSYNPSNPNNICREIRTMVQLISSMLFSPDIYDDRVADYFITENPVWTWERLSQQDVQHANELRCLDNPNIVPIWKHDFFNSHRWIVSIQQ